MNKIDKLVNGVFVSGKFSGQAAYASYFWEQVKQGLADDQQGNVYIFDITEKDIKKFPDLNRFDIVKISEDKNGFVSVEVDYD